MPVCDRTMTVMHRKNVGKRVECIQNPIGIVHPSMKIHCTFDKVFNCIVGCSTVVDVGITLTLLALSFQNRACLLCLSCWRRALSVDEGIDVGRLSGRWSMISSCGTSRIAFVQSGLV
jgi:hypothetical protein